MLARIFVALLFAVLHPAMVLAQSEPPAESANPAPHESDARFDSPQSTMFTFLRALGTRAKAPAFSEERTQAEMEIAECLGLEGLERAGAIDQALWLQAVLNRIGEVRAWELPDRSMAEQQNLTEFVYLPHSETWVRDQQKRLIERHNGARISFSRDLSGQWTFSTETVAGIRSFYLDVYRLKPVYNEEAQPFTLHLFLERQMPVALVRGQFMGMSYWQWLGLLTLILLGLIADQLVRFVLRSIWKRISRKQGTDVSRETLRKALRPFGYLATSLVWLFGVRALGLPPLALVPLLVASRLLLMLSGVWAAYRATDLISEFIGRRAAGTRTKIDDLAIPLIRKTLKVFITAMGLIYILQSLDVEVGPLLAGLGIGGIAFALAARDTIENFFGSVAVIVDQPFEIGDWVVIGDVEGTVEELGFRSTRVRTFYNSLITVPNATLVRATVDNYGRRRFRRYKTTVGVTYDTPPDRIEAFCEGIRELIRRHPYTRKDYYHVWTNAFAPSSIDILVYMFHEAPDWGTELRERHRFILDVMRLADALGVNFAFPTQTLHLVQEEDGAHVPAAPPGADVESKSQQMGRDAARSLTAEQEWDTGLPPPPVAFPSKSLREGELDAGE